MHFLYMDLLGILFLNYYQINHLKIVFNVGLKFKMSNKEQVKKLTG